MSYFWINEKFSVVRVICHDVLHLHAFAGRRQLILQSTPVNPVQMNELQFSSLLDHTIDNAARFGICRQKAVNFTVIAVKSSSKKLQFSSLLDHTTDNAARFGDITSTSRGGSIYILASSKR